MIPTLLGGIIPLVVALIFFGVLLADVQAVPLWVVVIGGIVLMVASLVEAVWGGEDQFGGEGRR